MIPKWAQDMRMEDIKSPAMADLAELIGIEAMMKIVEMYSGSVLYIPKMESVLACNIRWFRALKKRRTASVTGWTAGRMRSLSGRSESGRRRSGP